MRQRRRLLTEAEWEYAARAGTTTKYSWGDDIGSGNANCTGCGGQWDGKQTVPVGSFPANPFGQRDMHGNVWQWTQDCWNADYKSGPGTEAPRTTDECILRVVRDGSWNNNPRNLRASNRYRGSADNRSRGGGFRLARTLAP